MNKPLISVVIPAYNAEKYIEEALCSVLGQTYDNFEIVVVEDQSTDQTSSVIKKLAAKDARIRFFQNPRNLGIAKTRNFGIQAARGDFVAFLDADDYWEKNKIEKQLAIFERNDKVALVYSDGEIFGAPGNKVGHKFSEFEKFQRGKVFGFLAWRDFIPTSSVIVKKKILEQVGGFCEDEKMRVGEDYYLWLKIVRFREIDYCPECLIFYRVTQDSRSADKIKAYKAIAHVYKIWLRKKISVKHKIIFLVALIKTYLKILYKKILA